MRIVFLAPSLARLIPDQPAVFLASGLAREGLQKVQSMTEVPGFGAVVEMLKAGIEHHVEEEETQILPELKDELERSEWLALGDRIAEAKVAAGLPVAQPAKRKSSKRRSKAGASGNSKKK